jgi:UDP-N-acetyl-2-amino-2-deoxyglucuronate dehydrogenase
MMDFGCHRLEVLVNLLGEVDGIASSISKSVYQREVEDTAVATLHFTAGATATVSVTHATNIPKDTLQIFGTDGGIEIPVLNSGRLIVTTGADQREENLPPADNIHQPLVEDFVESVSCDRDPTVDGHAGRYISQLLEKIYDEK